MPNLIFTKQAKKQLAALQVDQSKLKRVRRCLALIETNPRHPGLNSHKYQSLSGPGGEDLWESYVENKTAAAWRIFWHYGPDPNQITIIAITPHP